jgi:hypothetical protein
LTNRPGGFVSNAINRSSLPRFVFARIAIRFRDIAGGAAHEGAKDGVFDA